MQVNLHVSSGDAKASVSLISYGKLPVNIAQKPLTICNMISEKFRMNTINTFGAAGAAWLATLPDLLQTYADRWSLALGDPFALSFNYVIAARRADGLPVVLKLGVPNQELRSEINALRVYAGRGAVHLLEADDAAGVFLQARVYPGEPIAEWEDERATRTAAMVMQRLWQLLPAEHPFRHVREWTDGFGRMPNRNLFGKGLVDRAEAILRELEADATQTVLLHGDLHHWNILTATRAPAIAIDPKGMAGDPAYEVGAFLRNPVGLVHASDKLPQIMARRIAIFSEMLGFERERLAAYGFAQAVLSAWWTVEDNGSGWENTLKIADVIRTTCLRS